MKTLAFKQVTPYIVALALIIAAAIYMQDCKGKQLTGSIPTKELDKMEVDKYEALGLVMANNKVLRDSIDKLTNVKATVIIKYRTKRDSIFIAAPDTCSSYLLALDKHHAKIDSVNDLIISKQETAMMNYDSQVSIYKDIVMIKNTRHAIDSSTIDGLNTELKQQVKRVKKERLKGVLLSVLSGLGGVGLGKIIP